MHVRAKKNNENDDKKHERKKMLHYGHKLKINEPNEKRNI